MDPGKCVNITGAGYMRVCFIVWKGSKGKKGWQLRIVLLPTLSFIDSFFCSINI